MGIPRSHASPATSRMSGVSLLSLLVLFLSVPFLLPSCGKDSTSPGDSAATWDIEGQGIPRFVNTDYIDLAAIERISRFRSAAGHDYTHDDTLEHCRSMKHYFWPKGGDPGHPHDPLWTSIPIKSPVDGTVSRLMEEFAGTQVWIKSNSHPAFELRIFHVALSTPLEVGSAVSEGQVLGHHGGDETMSDIAVRVATPQGSRLVSCFEVMTDALFASYQARGVSSRGQLIISREERDADPLTCSDETFTSGGHLADWVDLTAP